MRSGSLNGELRGGSLDGDLRGRSLGGDLFNDSSFRLLLRGFGGVLGLGDDPRSEPSSFEKKSFPKPPIVTSGQGAIEKEKSIYMFF